MLQLLWKYLRSVAGDLFDNTYDLVGLAELVVIPDIKHKVLPRSDGGKSIDYTSVGGTNEVTGDYLRGGDVGDLLAQVGVQRNIAQEVVDFFYVHVLGKLQVQHGHGNIRGGNANGVAGQLAFEFWQRLRDSLRSTGLGQNHVQTSSATTAVALVVVVNQVLVIGKGVCGFHVAVDYTVAVIDDLENRGNAVGGTRCSGENLVFCRHILVVDAVDNVLHIALTRCGKQHVGNALGLEVLDQALTVAPDTGVVHITSIVNDVV